MRGGILPRTGIAIMIVSWPLATIKCPWFSEVADVRYTLHVTMRTRSLKRWNWPVCLLRFLTVTLHSKKLVKSLGGRYQNLWILWKLLYLVTCGHLFCYFYFIALYRILCFPVNIYIFEKSLVMLVQWEIELEIRQK